MLTDLHEVPVLVRVGSAEPTLALRALDQGAAGILAPHVDSEADADALVDSVHYPPLEHWGFATYLRVRTFGPVRLAGLQHAEVNRTVTAHGALRMDIVPGREEATAAFADGADLVVYNLADTLMRHLAELGAVSRS